MQNNKKTKDQKKYTKAQHRALHLYFDNCAKALNDAGISLQVVLRKMLDVEFTKENFKKTVWLSAMKAATGKDSVTQLEKKEIDIVFDTVNRFLGEKFGIHIPFPDWKDFVGYNDNYEKRK